MISKISKITLYVNNQDDAKKFWTEKIGFSVKLEQPMGPNMKWLEVGPSQSDCTTLILYEKKLMMNQNPLTNVEHPSIILSTTDLDNAYSKMKKNGVEAEEIKDMPYGRMFSFKDQDGNYYLLREDN